MNIFMERYVCFLLRITFCFITVTFIFMEVIFNLNLSRNESQVYAISNSILPHCQIEELCHNMKIFLL